MIQDALLVTLDPARPMPLYRQLYDGLREAVLAGRLAPGGRLPPTRDLARALGVSRNTVMQAFEQLTAEGYLEGRVGAGTYVSAALPDQMLQAPRAPLRRSLPRIAEPQLLSERGRRLAATAVTLVRAVPEATAFRVGLPDLSAFPFETWTRILSKLWRRPPRELLGYGDPAGFAPLREAIAVHAAAARAVHCDAEQVIVVSGSQQALDLAARMLLDPDEMAWIEDPGYLGARAALTAAGANVVPVPVDGDGIDVAAGVAAAAKARLAYVTPSHQFPLGVTMTLPRRLALVEWAARAGAWVVEDDYDSEYRYAGRPLAALQGLDDGQRVIYVGTFSKVMFPALRVGYLIVPPAMVDAFTAARAVADRHPPTMEQAALAEFIAGGHLARHIRRMRALYDERRQLLIEGARRYLDGVMEIQPAEAGMHLVGRLPAGSDDRRSSKRAAAEGVEATALSSYVAGRAPFPALLLGYAATDPRAITVGVQALARALDADSSRRDAPGRARARG